MGLSIGVSLINGMMLGIEFPNKATLVDSDDIKFVFVADLLIIRCIFIWSK